MFTCLGTVSRKGTAQFQAKPVMCAYRSIEHVEQFLNIKCHLSFSVPVIRLIFSSAPLKRKRKPKFRDAFSPTLLK